jgi:hypothetical protein
MPVLLYLLKCPVGPFILPIRLGMTSCGHVQASASQLYQALPESTGEPWVPIGNQHGRRSVVPENMFKVQLSHTLGCDCRRCWNRTQHLGQTVDEHEDGIIPRILARRQLGYQI